MPLVYIAFADAAEEIANKVFRYTQNDSESTERHAVEVCRSLPCGPCQHQRPRQKQSGAVQQSEATRQAALQTERF